jgi:tryptophan synthase alpha chain
MSQPFRAAAQNSAPEEEPVVPTQESNETPSFREGFSDMPRPFKGEARIRFQGKTLIGYLPAGFPTVERAISALRVMVDAGVDLIEIGFPYSDPVMDGPVIQAACEQALAGGVRAADVLRTVEAVAATGTTAVVMSYWNLIEHYDFGRVAGRAGGVNAFARDLAAAGGAGLITPDLIPEEADEWLAASDAYGLDRIFLVAPSSTDERLAWTVRHCRGFVYATAVMGVTGVRAETSTAAPTLVERLRKITDLPIGVGLGVSTGTQAAQVASYADGVIVGSALVRCLQGVDQVTGETALRRMVTDLASGVRTR